MKTKFQIVLDDNLSRCIKLPKSKYEATLLLGSFQIKSMAVTYYSRLEDYVSNLFSLTFIEVNILPSQYYDLLQAGREHLKVKLTKLTQDNKIVNSRIYEAKLLGMGNEQIDNNINSIQNTDMMDKTSIKTITIQLIEQAAYNLLLREVGGIFRNDNAANVLKYYLAKQQLHDTYAMDDAVGSITFDSEIVDIKHDSIVVDDGTPLVNLGDYLQERYGIYNQGFGIYLKDLQWHIFAPYNVKKRTSKVDRLVVINAPANRYRAIDETYNLSGYTHTVIATAPTSSVRLDDNAMNTGTGVKFADPGKLLDGFSSDDPTATEPKLDPKSYMTEYTGFDYNNEQMLTRTVKGRFDANPTVAASNLAATGGYVITAGWDNGIIDGLIPGMPVEYIYENGRNMYSMYGTLLSAHEESVPMNGSMLDGIMNTTVKLSMFLKPLSV